jgi:DMSO/TMAO reductase YedYZ molybdopterin-dependent catalytic subunit
VPPPLLDDDVTPTSRFFRRNHFPIPDIDGTDWRLRIGGLVRRHVSYSLDELKSMGSVSVTAVLECAGNGRRLYAPAAPGEQWSLGAVGNAKWTGVPLADVLETAGVLPGAMVVVFRGADRGTVSDLRQPIAFERSMQVADARLAGALLAFAMNDEPLLPRHGYPLRLIVPGDYAVASVKWLTDVTVTDEPFAGFFQAQHYVFEWPRDGIVVREPVSGLRVRAIITAPASGDSMRDSAFTVRGLAWSGAAPVMRVMVSVADGQWRAARLVGQPGPHSWQRWELPVRPAAPGEVTIRARATDRAGRTQPVQPEWNRLGYGGNFIHEVTVRLR